MNAVRGFCVDAPLAVKWLICEQDHLKAKALLGEWDRRDAKLIASGFFEVECDSIIRRKYAVRDELTEDESDDAFVLLRQIPVKTISLPKQWECAWEMAKMLDHATVYDATYIALAELRGCELWTADEKLYSQAADKLPFVKRLANCEPS